jgi:hypothetical protein
MSELGPNADGEHVDPAGSPTATSPCPPRRQRRRLGGVPVVAPRWLHPGVPTPSAAWSTSWPPLPDRDSRELVFPPILRWSW